MATHRHTLNGKVNGKSRQLMIFACRLPFEGMSDLSVYWEEETETFDFSRKSLSNSEIK